MYINTVTRNTFNLKEKQLKTVFNLPYLHKNLFLCSYLKKFFLQKFVSSQVRSNFLLFLWFVLGKKTTTFYQFYSDALHTFYQQSKLNRKISEKNI